MKYLVTTQDEQEQDLHVLVDAADQDAAILAVRSHGYIPFEVTSYSNTSDVSGMPLDSLPTQTDKYRMKRRSPTGAVTNALKAHLQTADGKVTTVLLAVCLLAMFIGVPMAVLDKDGALRTRRHDRIVPSKQTAQATTPSLSYHGEVRDTEEVTLPDLGDTPSSGTPSSNPTAGELHSILRPAGYTVGMYGSNMAWKKGREAIYFEVQGSGSGQFKRRVKLLRLYDGGNEILSSRQVMIKQGRIFAFFAQEWMQIQTDRSVRSEEEAKDSGRLKTYGGDIPYDRKKYYSKKYEKMVDEIEGRQHSSSTPRLKDTMTERELDAHALETAADLLQSYTPEQLNKMSDRELLKLMIKSQKRR